MNPDLLFRVGSAQRLEILMLIKRSQGRSVGDLAARLGMSYMGIKAHCDELKRAKLCEVRRHSLGRSGRPELRYQLTETGNELFPGPDLTAFERMLDAATAIYGPAAPEKLLLGYYRDLETAHAKKMKSGPLVDRLKSLVKLREKEGHMPELEIVEASNPDEPPHWRLVEYHNFSVWLEERHPLCAKFEEQMLTRLLETPLIRECHGLGTPQRSVIFTPPPPAKQAS